MSDCQRLTHKEANNRSQRRAINAQLRGSLSKYLSFSVKYSLSFIHMFKNNNNIQNQVQKKKKIYQNFANQKHSCYHCLYSIIPFTPSPKKDYTSQKVLLLVSRASLFSVYVSLKSISTHQ